MPESVSLLEISRALGTIEGRLSGIEKGQVSLFERTSRVDRAVNEVQHDLGVMAEGIKGKLLPRLEVAERSVEEHEKKLNFFENNAARLKGFIAAVCLAGSLFGAFGAWATTYILSDFRVSISALADVPEIHDLPAAGVNRASRIPPTKQAQDN